MSICSLLKPHRCWFKSGREGQSVEPTLDAIQLEDRVLLSASPLADLLIQPDEPPAPADAFLGNDNLDGFLLDADGDRQHPHVLFADEVTHSRQRQPDPLEPARRELVVLDAAGEHDQQLMDDLLNNVDQDRQIDVLRLDVRHNGVEQITKVLSDYDELDAVHLISHGSQGQVKLGNQWLNIDNLDGYSSQIAQWGHALKDGADVLVYGCDVATSEDGRALTEALGQLCDCDVSASTDDTGHSALGGDWDLEYSVGHIETRIALSLGLQEDFRGLLSATPDGGEILVNTTTVNAQATPSEIRGGVAHDANGNFVTIWQSWNQDSDSYGVFGQRFDADGTAQGPEFQVNTETSNNQRRAAVAMDAAGNYVVVWDSDLQDGSGIGIYAQRYDSVGNPLGGEFQVNTETSNHQVYGSVAMDDAGNFVVTWSSAGQDGNSMGVFAQRYDFAGNPLGGEFQVNTYTNSSQQKSVVAMDADGDFVVAWASFTQDGSSNGVYAQRYDSSGTAQGGEFQVNTFTTDGQYDPTVAMDDEGNFIVAWTSAAQDSDGSSGVYGQRYSATGIRSGGEFRVNDVIAGDQEYASIAMRDNGYFAISFQSSNGQDGDQSGIYVKEYNAAGQAQGAAVLVNTTTSGNQRFPSLSMDDDQDFVVLWSGNGTGDGNGVFARRFNSNLSAVAVNDSYDMDQDTVLNVLPANGLLTDDTDEDGDPLTAVLLTDVSNGTLNLNVDGSFDYTPPLGYVGTDIFEYAAHDGTSNSNTAKVLIHVNQTSAVAVGSETRVNTTTANNQATLTDTPQNVATNGDGDSVVVWASNLQDDGSSWGIYAQLYDLQGNPVGGEILVNTTTVGDQLNPAVAMDNSGEFVVIWESSDGDGSGIHAQRFQSDGSKSGPQFLVNQTTVGDQSNATVAMDLFGGFVVGWESDDGNSSGIYARLYESDGDPDTGEFLVNTTTTGTQRSPSAAMDRTRDFLITWESDNSGDWDIHAQRFDQFATPQGGETVVNMTTANDQRYASAAMDDLGNYVVTWSSFGQDGDGMGVYALRFDSGGTTQGAEFQVSTETAGDQAFSTVSMDQNGNFVISWSSLNQDGSSWGVYAQEYDSIGNMRGGERQVNGTTSGSQSISSIALDDDRDFIVTWSGNGTGDTDGVFAQRYETNLKPTGYDDTYGVNQGASLSLDGPGVLANDAEPDSDAMTATLVTDVSQGSLGFNADGSLNYTPDAGFVGTDSFTYFANDGAFETEVVTVTLIVGPGPGGTGNEFRVNTFTGSTQENSDVAVAANGDFVVVWDSLNQDGGSWGVYGQRFSADGMPQGAEFRINQTTADRQRYVDVDLDLLGNFVVTWTSEGQDGDSFDESNIYMRRYDAAGNPLSGETLVNQTTNMDQSISTVAIDDATGNYLVTWTNESASSWDIMGRRYDALGNPLSGEFQINTSALDFGFVSNAAIDIFGNFVVTWTGADEDGWGIFARRFAWNETPFAAEYQVNSSAFGTQFISYIGMDATSGDHVIAWSSFGQDNDSASEGNVYGQRYDGSANPQGGEFLVNSHTSGTQWIGGVSMAPGGEFVITWQSNGQDGSGDGVYAQRYMADGSPEGAEFLVNSTTSSDQEGPTVAMDALGNFVISWEGNGPGDGAGVFGQLYEVVPVADDETYNVDEDSILIVGAASGVLVGDTDPNGDPLTAVLVRDVQNGTLVLSPDGSFIYTPDPEFDGQDTFMYVANDGANDSNYAVVTINVGQVNDAPVLDNNGAMSLSVNEDESNPAGTTVAVIIASGGGDRITDVDTAAEEGIAVAGLTSPSGTWEYSVDGGSMWNTFGALGDSSATLLDAVALVRFIPDIDFQGTGGTLSFRAWDHTSGSNGQTGVDVSTNGGETAFSTATETVDAIVNNVNDAPMLTPVSPALTPITEDDTASSGNMISSILGTSVNDIDPSAVEGIAITSLASGNGTWEYSTNGGGSWFAVGVVSDSSALLLRDIDRLRFVPDAIDADSASVTFRAWDQTTGTEGTSADASTNGGTTSFSSAIDTASITVTAVNDSAVLSGIEGSPLSYNENDGPVAITTSVTVNDIDDTTIESATIQITAGYSNGEDMLAFTDTANITGSWNGATGLLTLSGADTLANYDAALHSATYQNTSDDPSTATRTISLAVNDGDDPSNTVTRDLDVTAVNDGPLLDLDADDSSGQTGADFIAVFLNGGGPIAIADTDATLSDFDSFNVASLTVTITNQLDGPQELLDADVSGLPLIFKNYDPGTGTLTLTGVDLLANFQQVLRSVTYDNMASNPDPTPRAITFVANDGSDDGNVGTTTVVGPNVPPVLAGIEGGPLAYAENDGPIEITSTVTVSDADNTTIENAMVRIITGFANGEDMLAFTDTASITGSWNATTGTLTLSGTDTLSNYQGALRSISFENNSEAPSTSTRNVTFTINDGIASSNTVTRDVLVTSINDNPAIISNSSPNVNETSTAVTTVMVSDVDGGPPTFSISGGTDQAFFSVNSTTGELTFNAARDFENPADVDMDNVYQVEVAADDGNGGTDVQLVSVTVNDANDLPTITSSAAPLVTENTTAVLTVTAADQDGDALVYSLTGGADQLLFSIHATSGALAFNSPPDFESTADADSDNIYEVEVTVDDGNGGLDVQLINVNVVPVNDRFPVANTETVTVAEGGTATVFIGGATSVLDNDSDADLPPNVLVAVLDSGPNSAAAFSLYPDGTFSYTHDGTETTIDGFSYHVHDGVNDSNVIFIVINITPINDPPIGANDNYLAVQNQPFTVSASGVLGNDWDAEGNSLTAIPISGPSSGMLTLNPDGSFTYTPDQGFTGMDSFVYRPNDGTADGNAATVTISIGGPPPPGRSDDSPADNDNRPSPPGRSQTLSDVNEPGNNAQPPPREDSPPPRKLPSGGPSVDDLARFSITAGSGISSAIHPGENLTLAYEHDALVVDPQSDLRGFQNTITRDTRGTGILSAINDAALLRDLDVLGRDLNIAVEIHRWYVGAALTVTGTLTIGYVVWLIRAGYLTASLLSTMPAWRLIDPLPILEFADRGCQEDKEEDDESLQSLVQHRE